MGSKKKTPEMPKVEGSYFIRVKPSGNWFAYHQTYVDGKKVQKALPPESYEVLGFQRHWSVIQAKAFVQELNKERSAEKQTIRKAAQRASEILTVDEDFFPEQLCILFKKKLEEENQGSELHLKKIYSHFIFIQRMCLKLRLKPDEYRDSQKRIYNYFAAEKISVSYAKRLISLLNLWGAFHSKFKNKFFEPVQTIKGRFREKIADAQTTKHGVETKLGVKEESAPLTEVALKKLKDHVTEELYNWLFLSVYLGLRPSEVDSLKKEVNYKLQVDGEKKVLWVYQPKLQSLPKEKRWKLIPLFLPQQLMCLDVIASGTFKKCSYKFARSVLPKGVTFYGGRKNFIDMMLSYDQKLEDISNWLGHTSIDTSWKHYRNKKAVNFVKIESKNLKLVK